MTSGTDYAAEYKQAEKAYVQGNYAEAALIADRLVESRPQDPNIHLLRGHICCYGLQNYDLARHHYQAVLDLTREPDLVEYAQAGLETIEQLMREAPQPEPLGEAVSAKNDQLGFDPFGEPVMPGGLQDSEGMATSIWEPLGPGAGDPPTDGDVTLFVHNEELVTNQSAPEAHDFAFTTTLESSTQGAPRESASDILEATNFLSDLDSTRATAGTGQSPVADVLADNQFLSEDQASPQSAPGGTPAPHSSRYVVVERSPLRPAKPATPRQGAIAFFANAPLERKTRITGVLTGFLAAAAALVVSQGLAPGDKTLRNPVTWGEALAAGLVAGGAAWSLGEAMTGQVKRDTEALKQLLAQAAQGNLEVQAPVTSQDAMGQLASEFNKMTRSFLATTREFKRRAEEQEQQKENLQRQVIRLLDDVEGAARGDLTVQAEVTADVLGAVADSFNLTIQNLREIVQKVKQAARQVNRGAGENETFARALNSDALRQAEELAVTLNSIQMLTNSIQRVASSAQEAQEVARVASLTALQGGEAVDRTVAGILEIRETVAQTTRQVKRLAESSQEISKIVGLISQIASRTNLLALNASIEAARAGDAGRGFAIVADEVRQLADRASKSSREIEQIVLQIQSETGSVMTAMEEGTQQVIQGTRLAEDAKRSLDKIIQVSQQIDGLVSSITAATVEQTDASRQVSQVMQSVELAAQETSQESQRVSASLQNLVGVARDLLNSVEQFRVERQEPR